MKARLVAIAAVVTAAVGGCAPAGAASYDYAGLGGCSPDVEHIEVTAERTALFVFGPLDEACAQRVWRVHVDGGPGSTDVYYDSTVTVDAVDGARAEVELPCVSTVQLDTMLPGVDQPYAAAVVELAPCAEQASLVVEAVAARQPEGSPPPTLPADLTPEEVDDHERARHAAPGGQGVAEAKPAQAVQVESIALTGRDPIPPLVLGLLLVAAGGALVARSRRYTF